MVNGLDEGADDYMAKPVERMLLAASVRAMIGLKELNEKIVEAEKLKTFAAKAITASHEINNPLTGIIWNIELLKTEKDLDEEKKQRMIATIYEQAQKTSKTVRRFSNIIEPY